MKRKIFKASILLRIILMGEKKSDKERVAKGEVLVRSILEILGAPKEHVEKTITVLVDKLKEKAIVDVVSEEIFEASETEDGKLFTA